MHNSLLNTDVAPNLKKAMGNPCERIITPTISWHCSLSRQVVILDIGPQRSLSTNRVPPTSADSNSYRSLLILATAGVAPALASLLALLPVSRPRLGSLCWIPLTIAVALVLTSLWRLAITRRPLRNKHKYSRSSTYLCNGKKGNGSPYSITKHRVLELIPVLDNQPAGDVSHKPGCRLSLLSARPAVTPATLKRAATNFATL